MSNSLAPEPIIRAALRVLHVASYATRNWTLSEDISRKQINALWEAVHEIPDLIQRWRNDDEGLRELRMYLREYDRHWTFPKLEEILDHALNDSEQDSASHVSPPELLDGRGRVTMIEASILWRRLDTPGHDACRLERSAAGWRIEGTAVFRHEGVPAQLSYYVTCDPAWHTQQGQVHGWLGADSLEFGIVRTSAGVWTLNGVLVPGLEDCVDLDFGFTPATNLLQLRRAALAVGQAADVPVAWLDVPAGTLTILPQRYERRSAATYWYESPSVGYEGLLEVGPTGFIHRYPGLWEAEL